MAIASPSLAKKAMKKNATHVSGDTTGLPSVQDIWVGERMYAHPPCRPTFGYAGAGGRFRAAGRCTIRRSDPLRAAVLELTLAAPTPLGQVPRLNQHYSIFA
ncbi:hypothetical protein, partial [Longimicrobium sp.]|uniref:hypothetical protein n=1 Tax=Longimicrobium sp. TaxID=2029185 RepID=UPI002E34033A